MCNEYQRSSYQFFRRRNIALTIKFMHQFKVSRAEGIFSKISLIINVLALQLTAQITWPCSRGFESSEMTLADVIQNITYQTSVNWPSAKEYFTCFITLFGCLPKAFNQNENFLSSRKEEEGLMIVYLHFKCIDENKLTCKMNGWIRNQHASIFMNWLRLRTI